MRSLRVWIVDDEAPARHRLRALLTEQHIEVIGESPHGKHLFDQPADDVDVFFLDVEMPGLNGIQVATELRSQGRPAQVIFLTAFREFGPEAFALEATDYLLKPVRPERLAQSIAKATDRALSAKSELRLLVQSQGMSVRVPIGQINAFFARDKYVTFTVGGQEHVLDESLSNLLERFSTEFIRVHRSVLVRREAIESLSHADGILRLTDGTQISVSRRHLAELKKVVST